MNYITRFNNSGAWVKDYDTLEEKFMSLKQLKTTKRKILGLSEEGASIHPCHIDSKLKLLSGITLEVSSDGMIQCVLFERDSALDVKKYAKKIGTCSIYGEEGTLILSDGIDIEDCFFAEFDTNNLKFDIHECSDDYAIWFYELLHSRAYLNEMLSSMYFKAFADKVVIDIPDRRNAFLWRYRKSGIERWFYILHMPGVRGYIYKLFRDQFFFTEKDPLLGYAYKQLIESAKELDLGQMEDFYTNRGTAIVTDEMIDTVGKVYDVAAMVSKTDDKEMEANFMAYLSSCLHF